MYFGLQCGKQVGVRTPHKFAQNTSKKAFFKTCSKKQWKKLAVKLLVAKVIVGRFGKSDTNVLAAAAAHVISQQTCQRPRDMTSVFIASYYLITAGNYDVRTHGLYLLVSS